MGIRIESCVNSAPTPPLHMLGAVNHSSSFHALANSYIAIFAWSKWKLEFRPRLGHRKLLQPPTQRNCSSRKPLSGLNAFTGKGVPPTKFPVTRRTRQVKFNQ